VRFNREPTTPSPPRTGYPDRRACCLQAMSRAQDARSHKFRCMGTINQCFDSAGPGALEQAMDVVESAWESREPGVRARLIALLGELPGYQLKERTQWPQAEFPIRRFIRMADPFRLARVLSFCYVHGMPGLVVRLYQGLGFTRVTTIEDTADQIEAPSSDSFVEAWLRSEDNTSPHFMMMTAVIADAGQTDQWKAAAAGAFAKIRKLHEERATAPREEADPAPGVSPEPASEAKPPAAVPADDHKVERRPPKPRTTALDDVLIRLMVDTADGQQGARTPAEIDAVIQEFTRLNSARYQSRFHRGFWAAIFGKPLPARTSGAENDERRSWLLAGWLMGRLRDGSREITSEIDMLGADDQGALLSERGRPAAEQIADEIIRRLAKAGATAAIARWMRFASPEGGHAAIRHARQLLRDGRPAEAEQLGRVILGTMPGVGGARMTISDIDIGAMTVVATAARMLGHFDMAMHHLNEVGEFGAAMVNGKPPDELPESLLRVFADANAQQVLCSARITDVASLWFHRNPADQSLRVQLAPIGPLLAQHVAGAAAAHSGTLCYCAALWILDRPSDPAARAAMADCMTALGSVIAQLHADDAPRLTRSLLPRMILLRALITTHSGAGHLGEAIRDINEFELAHGNLPFHVIRPAIEAGIAADVGGVEDIILRRIDHDLQNFIRSDLLKLIVKHERVGRAVFENFRSCTANLSRSDQAQVAASVFAASVDAGADREQMGELADEMIDLAKEFRGGAEGCLAVFVERDRWSYIWNELEFTGIRARLAESVSENARRATCQWLFERSHHLAFDEPELAEECLELAEWLGLPAEAGAGVRAMITRKQVSTPSGTATETRSVRVLFVGGDERQQKMQAEVSRIVHAANPGVCISFLHPGWGSNWKDAIEAMKRQLPESDIVVLNPFVRTNFGKTARRSINEAGKQWRPTYGHAPASIARAIVNAATVAGT
jgi:hypothetical protein